MEIRHLYSFFADIYAFFLFRALFLSEIVSFLQYSTMLLTLLHMQQISNCKAPFACNNQIIIAFLLQLNTNQQTTVRLQQKTKQQYVVSHETKH